MPGFKDALFYGWQGQRYSGSITVHEGIGYTGDEVNGTGRNIFISFVPAEGVSIMRSIMKGDFCPLFSHPAHVARSDPPARTVETTIVLQPTRCSHKLPLGSRRVMLVIELLGKY